VRRLLSSELLRFRSRRLVVVMLIGALVAMGVGIVIAAWQSTPPTDAVIAAARAQAREELEHCLEGVFDLPEEFPGSPEEFCRENFGNPAHYMPSHLALVDLPQILEGISSITSILGLVIGASIVAASWQTGTISTIFTWEPRRLRWFAARIMVVAAGLLVMTALIVSFLSAGLALAAMLRGSTAGVGGEWWTDVLTTTLRLSVAAAVAGVIGGAVAAVGRHTAAALGAVFIYTAVLEGLVRGFRPEWTPWLLGDNIVAFISWQATSFQLASGSFVLSPGRAVFVILGYVAVLLALGSVFVRTRDVQ